MATTKQELREIDIRLNALSALVSGHSEKIEQLQSPNIARASMEEENKTLTEKLASKTDELRYMRETLVDVCQIVKIPGYKPGMTTRSLLQLLVSAAYDRKAGEA